MIPGQPRSCPSCGSTMIIELERSADDSAAEAAELGVPACEDMELELQLSPPPPTSCTPPQAASLKETEFRSKLNNSSTPKKKEDDRSERNRSVESEGKSLLSAFGLELWPFSFTVVLNGLK